jgi:hypothetical protein
MSTRCRREPAFYTFWTKLSKGEEGSEEGGKSKKDNRHAEGQKTLSQVTPG